MVQTSVMRLSLPARAVLLRRVAIALAVLFAFWLIAWLAVPPILKSQAQTRLSALLGRPVTIGAVEFRPWSLELTVRDLTVGAANDSPTPLLHWARAYVNADMATLWRRAPVLSALEVDGLQLNVTHVSPGHYDIDDLIERFKPDPNAPAGEPQRFALYNVKVADAAFSFDDRPAQRVHRVEAFQLALPFVSNLPSKLDVTVEPRVAFRLNGASFDSGAEAVPFAKERRGELKLAVRDLDLAPYAVYLPASLPLRLNKGVLGGELALRFEQPPDADPSAVLSGSVALKDLAIGESSGAALLEWSNLQVALRDVQPLARRVALGAVKLEGARLHLSRDAAGRLNLQRLSTPAADSGRTAAVAPASASASSPRAATVQPAWQAAIDRLDVDDARVLWNDDAVKPAAALQLEAMRVHGEKLAWPTREPVPLSLQTHLRGQTEGAALAGQLAVQAQVNEHSASGTLALDALALDALAPYVAEALVPRLEGKASAKGRFEWSDAKDAPKTMLTLESASLDGMRLVSGSGRAARDELAFKQLTLADARVDLGARSVDVGRVALAQPMVNVQRDDQGRWNLATMAKAASQESPGEGAPSSGDQASPWKLRLKDAQIDGGRVRLVDAFAPGHAIDAPARVDVTALRLRLQEFAWPAAKGTAPARLQLGAQVAGVAAAGAETPAAGRIEWNGRIAAEPLLVAGRLRLERLPVHAFEPYFDDAAPVALLHADAHWQGDLDLRQSSAGWSVKTSGDARLADVRVHTRGDTASGPGDELLSWQSFTLDGLNFAMAPQATPQLEIRMAALNDFFARLMVTEQGRFNLSSVSAPPAAASAPATPAAGASAPASAPAVAASAPAASATAPIAIAIGGVKLANGRVDFTDHFVRPNYRADLTELNGSLGAFRSGSHEMAPLELRGRAAGTALLDIRGALNPLADPLALDIQAKATDLELAPLSPYAGKYAGYAIERGKLSMEVAYKIAPDGKLEAKNQVVLNQLTFGDKVDSPDATKLPVLLAVALLKDRNGVIDINLPVSGSINDPQFSVFGIVFKLIGNLLAKAITAPFALLAGGGSEDLSLVEFKPGTATLGEAGRAALDKVAKALADRPALKMTVTGAADPAGERAALQAAMLEAQLLAERRRELLRGGASAADADALVSLDAAVRARMLKEVYRATDLPDKPRNAFGFARDIPGEQMEQLLVRRITVGPDAMHELALQRGLVVRDALLARGLPGERLFLASPKLRAAGDEGAGWTPRAQLSLSTN